MNLFAKYEVDPKKENDGFEFHIEGTDAVFLLRRAGGGNRRYRAALSDAGLKFADLLGSDDKFVQFAAEDDTTLEAFAYSVVTGWKNITDRAGNPWEFSPENFIEMMKACPDVWIMIRAAARDMANYRAEQGREIGEQLGN